VPGDGGYEDRLLAKLMRRRMRRLAAEREKATGEATQSEIVPAVFKAQEELIGRYAPGRTFVDLACLWIMNGGCAFVAEALGATRVTASDKWPANEEFDALHEERDSHVVFRQADLHEPEHVAALGVHDVVWCSGLMYHTPSPYLVMANLLSITGEYLIVGSKVIPDIPGLPGAAVYYPGLDEEQRRAYAPISKTVAEQPFVFENHAANWFWGLSPEALVSLAGSIRPVELVEEVQLPWLRRHDSCYLVLKVGDPA
jgi:hypothetical protein